MEFITEQGEGRANKEQAEKSCIASHNNFIFIDKYILFVKQCLSLILMHEQNLL